MRPASRLMPALLMFLLFTTNSAIDTQYAAQVLNPNLDQKPNSNNQTAVVPEEDWNPRKEGYQLLNMWFTGWGAVFFDPPGDSPLNKKSYAVNPEYRSFPEGTIIRMRVIPADGYRFEGWWVPNTGFTEKASKSDALPSTQLTISMNRERYVWAVFVKNEDKLDLYDVDGDGLSKYREDEFKTDENSSDTDNDGLPDGWEVSYKLNPTSGTGDDGPDGDPDRDGVPNTEELKNGTSPRLNEKAFIESLKEDPQSTRPIE